MGEIVTKPDIYQDHRVFREYLIADLKRSVFGPDSESTNEDQAEILPIPPLQIYATGVLFPQKTVQDVLEDSSEDVDVSEGETDEPSSEIKIDAAIGKKSTINEEATASHFTEPLNLANEFSPSAVGISFRIGEPGIVQFFVSFGTYEKTKVQQPNPKAGKLSMNGSVEPEFRDVTAYRRVHHSPAPISVEVESKNQRLPGLIVESGLDKLQLHVTTRKRSDETIVVSAMLVNENLSSGDSFAPESEECFFQVDFGVRSVDGSSIFMPVDFGGGNVEDHELKSLQLLYRHRRAFALGHGVSGDWNRDEVQSERGLVDLVRTAAVPVYELKPIKPRTSAFGGAPLNLGMGLLAGEGSNQNCKNKILESLRSLCDDYESWIADVEQQSAGLDLAMQDAAMGHLEKCRNCVKRMAEGVRVLSENDSAFSSFRVMNKSMLIQQHHSSLPARGIDTSYPVIPEGYVETKEPKRAWRPFQLAFVLMNLAGMTNENHDDRRMVDLIWFPTGGGKTEAYLGLAAFSIAFERLSGSAKGTCVLMRYTLRLLTAQQFQRAAALILALEKIRNDAEFGLDLGGNEISIGLWVGESLSPNKRVDARQSLKKMKADKFARNPFQVLSCPWCGIDLTEKGRMGYTESKTSSGVKTVKICCSDPMCRFHHTRGGLPIYVIDEDLYDHPPTLLIGTVDKFAQIAWSNEVGSFFGIGNSATPPVLVIQDELHLISGPLGTMVGLYETAIDRLCSRNGHIHKIIASTATIRRAERQCKDLYDRDTFEFPPQGIRAGDSYFAYEDSEAAGRSYVGIMGTAVKSHQTALVRSCSPLLQSVCYSRPEKGETDDLELERIKNIVNPYGTLVWYFNSLRELGHAATLCNGDIPEHLKSTCSRLDIPYDQRRYIREIVELTSRRSADEIPDILKRLDVDWAMGGSQNPPIDVLLATNMIAVGVDVPRLGLIVMSGQPKSASEYIQATSRVGRLHPGLVVTVYTQTKSRDRSHYERFVAYHQSIYRYVEPTSVTPFSPQARDRGMRGLLVGLARQLAGVSKPDQINEKVAEVESEIEFILDRIESLDPDEREEAEIELHDWLDFWKGYSPPEYGKMGGTVDTATLVYPFGSSPDPDHQEHAWPQMTSMRNVDGTCSAQVLHFYQDAEIDQEAEAEQ